MQNKFFGTALLVVATFLSLGTIAARAEEGTKFFCVQESSIDAVKAALRKDAEYEGGYDEATNFIIDALVADEKCYELPTIDVEFINSASEASGELIGETYIASGEAMAHVPPTATKGGTMVHGYALVAIDAPVETASASE